MISVKPMELYYADRSSINGNRIELDDFERKHVLQVLRKGYGDTIQVTDGCGNIYKTHILSTNPKMLLSVFEHHHKAVPRPEINLAIGYIRPNRLEFVFEKGCELGVTRFYVVNTRYANYYSANTLRYKKVLRQALKQSQKYYMPEIFTMESMDSFLKHIPASDFSLAAIDSSRDNLLDILQQKISVESTSDILLFIGPEGGFTAEEVEFLQGNGFTGVSLGSSRLRAETAAISGISIIQMYINQQKERALDT